MKKVSALFLACLMFAAVPVYAQSSSQGQVSAQEKDECLLAARGCANEVDSIQKQVKKLQKEIRKGDRVYTKEELQTLKRKLEEVNSLLADLNKPGGGGGGGGGR
ncbi:hypothetical protein LPW11_19915 [Geomonas sp. RF6]|uniref:hypothetical protein n=1 Tax=Geomonas sp. RF6 TaxID=2897342 RepID=UPI001E4FCBA4|nr:hypothetical protein [Geomonas sp. RF6]UFS70128.1 hypothetical protein LPW11_19915 [Geomonas sp. RF6]